jgi:hypothetical protein
MSLDEAHRLEQGLQLMGIYDRAWLVLDTWKRDSQPGEQEPSQVRDARHLIISVMNGDLRD